MCVEVAYFFIYYFVFRWTILKFNLMTVGREESSPVTLNVHEDTAIADIPTPDKSELQAAEQMVKALGGKENIKSLDNCVTRLRLTIADMGLIDEVAIKELAGLRLLNLIKIPYKSLSVLKSSPCVGIWITTWGYADGCFNTPVSRKGTYCTQWDFCEDRFGVKDVLPFSISDMDLPIPDAIIRALRKRLEHPILGYSRWQHDDYLNAIVNWYHQQYKTEIKPEWITYSPSVMYSIAKAIELLTSHGDNILVLHLSIMHF